ncbi:ATP-dependent DNA helicase [Trichonephila clavata]|uniref:ATP-dependent DNA helicase n=1 Tax=Trichonephila clavata TaxID=2740835 RepID=A0A8X6FIP2_TRICU|nr:ATP-dependent DNA helicase [Trichonephila clavata]
MRKSLLIADGRPMGNPQDLDIIATKRLIEQGSSIKCTFLNTRKSEQRYKVLKFDSNGTATGYCSNIIERYEKRPTEHPNYDFDNMCLLEFAMLFEPHYEKSNQEPEKCVDIYEPESQTRQRLITLTDNSKIVIRNVPAVVCVPYFVASSDPENYYYSLLLQYVPFRNESELIVDYDTARDSFLVKESDLRATNARLEIFRERDRQLENALNKIHALKS